MQGLALPEYLLIFINNYLCTRSQFVQIGSSQSAAYFSRSGVPQGSVLGPLLFVMATASLQQLVLSERVSIISYADDILLIKPIMQHDCLSLLERDLNLISLQ